jgi:hypothetical protein
LGAGGSTCAPSPITNESSSSSLISASSSGVGTQEEKKEDKEWTLFNQRAAFMINSSFWDSCDYRGRLDNPQTKMIKFSWTSKKVNKVSDLRLVKFS